jgi:Fe-S-cluster containining protein
MPPSPTSPPQDRTGEALWMLHHPVLPLFRIIQFLFLTGPFTAVEEILRELSEPIETNTARYEDPQAFLQPYLPIMKGVERLKDQAGKDSAPVAVVDHQGKPVNRFSAMEAWVGQQLLEAELEKINSLLCGPCSCVLCCVGPDYSSGPDRAREMRQDFFEIPLEPQEIALFDVERVDTEQTRDHTPHSEPMLQVDGRPFFEGDPTLYNWATGWSMILTRESHCPHLETQQGGCRIYPRRPAVCRKPQIFPYLLEQADRAADRQEEADKLVYVEQDKILAVWDCPYVKQYKQKIIFYAEVCGLEPVFMENKK